MFKFIHAADIHLDSPLRGLERYEGAPVEQIRQATRRALANLVELAIDERVAFVLIAGDLYDGDWPDYNTGLYMVGQLRKLREAGIPVFLISGNHDADNKMTLKLDFTGVAELLSTDAPETRFLEEVGVAIHGQGFATAAVTDDLSLQYPARVSGYFNIGMLHTCASGLDGHAPYAPCSLDGLRSKQYDYWALGHVHTRQCPWAGHETIAFPGNVQGRHIRETGSKGCLLVTVEDDDRARSEFRPLDVFRWERCTVDATSAAAGSDVLDLFTDELHALVNRSDGLPLAVRVEVVGPSEAHGDLASSPERWVNEIRARAIHDAAERVWLEKIQLRTTAPVSGGLDALDGPLRELLAIVQEIRNDDQRLQEADGELADLRRKLAAELSPEELDAIAPGDPTWLGGVLGQIEQMLVGRLLNHRPSAKGDGSRL